MKITKDNFKTVFIRGGLSVRWAHDNSVIRDYLCVCPLTLFKVCPSNAEKRANMLVKLLVKNFYEIHMELNGKDKNARFRLVRNAIL